MTEYKEQRSGRSKMKRIFAVALIIGVLALLGLLLSREPSIDGEYSGELLNSLSPDAFLVLKSGCVYIKLEDDLVPFGNYSRTNGGFLLFQTGSTNPWLIERQFRGFVMVSSTNDSVRYGFTNQRLKLPWE